MAGSELRVENLKVSFSGRDGKLTAVNGINYSLKTGEILAIVGESGCGKTVGALSLLRLIPEPPGKIENRERHIQLPRSSQIESATTPGSSWEGYRHGIPGPR